MPNTTLNINVSGAGGQISQNINKTTTGVDEREVALNTLGQPGNITSGTITMTNGGHGITTAQVVDVFWVASGVNKANYKATVGTVSGTSVPITGGSGDTLPGSGTAVVVAVRVQIPVPLSATLIAILAMQFVSADSTNVTDQAHVQFFNASDTSEGALKFLSNIPQVFDIIDGVAATPLSADCTYVMASNGSTVNTTTFKIISATN